MDVLAAVAWGGAGIATAVGMELGAARLLRAVLLAREPLSGEHIDSAVYHRSLWTPDQPELWPARIALGASGLLAAADLGGVAGWLMEPALLAWCAALAWDLWTWERVAASVKFVTWRRGWQRSARRVAVSELREVAVFRCPRPRARAAPPAPGRRPSRPAPGRRQRQAAGHPGLVRAARRAWRRWRTSCGCRWTWWPTTGAAPRPTSAPPHAARASRRHRRCTRRPRSTRSALPRAG